MSVEQEDRFTEENLPKIKPEDDDQSVPVDGETFLGDFFSLIGRRGDEGLAIGERNRAAEVDHRNSITDDLEESLMMLSPFRIDGRRRAIRDIVLLVNR